jgi:hypothetical protein
VSAIEPTGGAALLRPGADLAQLAFVYRDKAEMERQFAGAGAA